MRAKGYSGKDFRENSAFVSGGLKRVQLPPNYREFIFETLTFLRQRFCLTYGMQETQHQRPSLQGRPLPHGALGHAAAAG